MASSKKLRAAARGAALALALGAGTAQADPAFGDWLVQSERAVIRIAPCEGRAAEACGRIVWLKEPSDADGTPKRDRANPAPGRRDAPLCGLRLIEGLERKADGVWVDGEIYDARRGKTFDVDIRVLKDGRLKVRGYVMLRLFGRSQRWTRTEPRAGCAAARGPTG